MKTKIFETENHRGHTILRMKFDKLDTQVSPQLKAEFLVVCQSPLKKLIVDMTTVKSCDSSGLSALLVAERLMRESKGRSILLYRARMFEIFSRLLSWKRSFRFTPPLKPSADKETDHRQH